MIDTHCHLLPGIDDGPRSTEDAVRLARSLVDQGVEIALCTPHWSSVFPTEHTDAVRARDVLHEELVRREVPLRLELAAESSLAFAATQPIEELRLRSVGGHVIVELVPDSLPNLLHATCVRLAEHDLIPVLAHPERWPEAQRDTASLAPARSSGALVQVVAPSLTGRWGRPTREAAWTLLGEGLADLLASDAHDTGRRRCELAEVHELVAERLGAARWQEVALDAPRRLLDGPASDVQASVT